MGEINPTPTKSGKLSERSWTFLVIGLTLLVSIVSYLRYTPTARPPGGGASVISPDLVPLATGEEPVEQLFVRAGCVVCHTIPGIPGAEGRVGPVLTMGDSARLRLADPDYHGNAKTVREYIIESILSPGTYIVPGYPPNVMPRWYGKKLSAGALDKIGAYLESLTAGDTGR